MVTRPNYLALQAWGRKPRSKRRRDAAISAWLVPTIIFLGSVVGIGIAAFVFGMMFNAHEYLDDGARAVAPTLLDALPFALGGMFFASWLVGLVLCALMPFMLENRFGNANVVQQNLADYKLAGFTAHQILKGLTAPQLKGVHLLSWVYPLVTSVLLLAVMFVVHGDPGGVVIITLFTVIAAVINLLAGAYFALALWSKKSSKGERLFLIALFTISPLFGTIAAIPIVAVLSILTFGSGGVFLLIIPFAFAVPIVVAIKSWLNAIKRIDTPPTEDDLAFLPPSPAKSDAAQFTASASRNELGPANRP